MIEINLLPGQRKKRGGGLSLPDFKELGSAIKDPLLIGAVVAWVAAVAVIGFVYVTVTSQARGLDPELRAVERESRDYRRLIVRKEQLERTRDSLVRELDAIRNIDADRFVWPHVMEEINQALPDFTWLVSISALPAPAPIEGEVGPVPIRFSIDGRTADIQAYTRFARELENSPWLGDIVLGATQTVIEENLPITSFQIRGTYTQADSTFIRTVPVTRVVR